MAYAVAVATSVIATGASAQLEEVIVTAQKRAESAQDIPIAVSAFGSDEIKAMDAKGFGAIVLRTPGLSGSADADTQSVLTVRGIGTAAFSPGADNSVGTYFNEVPVSRNIAGTGYLDVERIEVVKGPQGTLFGRNTSSGAISITNQFALVGENTLETRVSAGDEGQQLYEAIGNWSATDNLAFRASARHDERDGTYKANGDELNGRDHDQGRIGLTWDATDAVTVNAYYEKYKVTNRWQMVDALGVFGNDPYADNIDVNKQQEQEIDSDFAVAKVNWDFSESMSLTSTSGYYNSDITALPTDADTGPVLMADFVEPWDLEQYTQEFRINGAGERFNWFVGASYYYEKAEVTSVLNVYEEGLLPFFTGEDGICEFTASEGYPCGLHTENGYAKNETTSYAVFGDLVWDVTDKLALTVGLRYTDEQKDMTVDSALQDTATTFLLGGNLTFIDTPGAIGEKENWNSTDPRVAVDYMVGEDTMIYANYAKGFKSGGFNRQPSSPGGSNIASFDPEENDAYEVGIKTDFWDQRARLNISGFFYDYTDFQLETNDNASILIQNVASLETKGIEIEGTFLIGESLDIRLAYAYLDAEFTDGSVNIDGVITQLDGNKSIRSPENTFSAVGTWHITEQIDARLEYAYTDEMYYTADNSSDYFIEDYNLFNARLDYNAESGKWGVSVIGDNIGDEEYIVSMTPFLLPMQLPGYGRSVRFEARYNFF